jgi:hypothetical protein
MINFQPRRSAHIKNRRVLLALLMMPAIAATAAAQHSDVLLVNIGGEVVVGTASDIDGPNEELALDAGAFESILRIGFAPPTPADYETDEPGFFALHGIDDAADHATLGAAPLPANSPVTANLTSFAVGGDSGTLFYWNGVGPVDFQPIATSQPGVTFAFSPPSFGVTGGNGELDGHPIYQLNLAGGAAPADGVYVISPSINVFGLTPSDNFYAVLLADALITGEDQLELVEHALEDLEAGAPNALVDFGGGVTKDFAYYEEAVEWVESNLVVPEPTTPLLALFGSALIAMSGRRRRPLGVIIEAPR